MFQMSASSIVSGCCGVAAVSLTGRLRPVKGPPTRMSTVGPEAAACQGSCDFHKAVTGTSETTDMATASFAGAGKQHRPVDEWPELNEFETEQASGDQRQFTQMRPRAPDIVRL